MPIAIKRWSGAEGSELSAECWLKSFPGACEYPLGKPTRNFSPASVFSIGVPNAL